MIPIVLFLENHRRCIVFAICVTILFELSLHGREPAYCRCGFRHPRHAIASCSLTFTTDTRSPNFTGHDKILKQSSSCVLPRDLRRGELLGTARTARHGCALGV